MQDKIQNKINKLNETRFMQCTVHLCRTFWAVMGVIVPAGLSGYLLVTNPDMVVTVVGVGSGVLSLVNLTKTAYKATETPVKKSKKASK